MRNLRFYTPVVFCALMASCSASKSEATRFSKLLNKQATILDGLNPQETTTMRELQAWAGQESFMGGPSFLSFAGQLDSKQTQASQNARSFRTRIGSLRSSLESLSQELNSQQLNRPDIQAVRSGLVQAIQARSRLLGELDPLLENYAVGIVDLNLQPGHRPSSIDTIVAKVSGHQPPANNIRQALQDLRTKYSISDSEIVN